MSPRNLNDFFKSGYGFDIQVIMFLKSNTASMCLIRTSKYHASVNVRHIQIQTRHSL